MPESHEAATSTLAVDVRSLERRFGYTRVLAGLELSVGHREHVTITGPNGSGKTTLLRILAGLLRPSGGMVQILGGSPSDPSVRRRMGVLSHAPALYPRMTASENLRFWGRLYGVDGAPSRGCEILASLGIAPDDPRPVSEYSQGMRQRVGVARTLCTDPELVIADEPLAALDSSGAATVATLLGRDRTLVTATHDPHRFEASRRFALERGELRAIP